MASTAITACAALFSLAALGEETVPTDFADAAHLDAWHRHPVYGDPSFDAFERASGNPIHRGAPPFEWPVNGFLFEDPVSGNWYVYIGLYAEGYAMGEGKRMACTVYEIKPAPNITSGNEALGRTLAYQSPSDRWCAARGRKVALRKALPGVYPGGKEHKGPRRQVWEAYNEWETMSQRAKAVSEQEGKLRPEPVF